jgi:hypothetical protein
MLPIVPADIAPVAHGLAVVSWVSPALPLTPFELAFALLEFAFCLTAIVAVRGLMERERHASTMDEHTVSHLPRAA